MITLLLTVLCTDSPALHHVYSETTYADYEHDLQLLRMGWVDGDRRCKAIRVRFSKT